MRVKSRKLVVTFHTTTAAMGMELACGTAGLPGRLIPVPREIDLAVAAEKLRTLGVGIDSLTPEQKKYLGVE